ncbi:MAG: PQQ-binding-like beta-propeller repeat protein [Thermaerobacter sp.]|nr:PQQ-binding-like beta-propeller repeat protein [Thermaerobacter sp.]
MRRKYVVAMASVAVVVLGVITGYFRVFHWQERSADAWIRGPLVITANTVLHGELEYGRVFEWSLDRFQLLRTMQLPEEGIFNWVPTRVHAVDRGVIVVSTHRVLYGIDHATGEVKWAHSVSPREVIVGEAVYYVSHNGSVGAIHPEGGHQMWLASAIGAVAGTLSGEALVAIGPNSISALRAQTGEVLWSLDYDGMAGDYGPFITATESGVAVIYQDATGAAVGIGLNANTGEVRWSKAQPFPFPYVHSLIGEAGVAFATLRRGAVTALDVHSGEQVWSRQLNFAPADVRSSPFITPDRILLIGGYSLVELDRASGEQKQRIRLPGGRGIGEIGLCRKGHYVFFNERELYRKRR